MQAVTDPGEGEKRLHSQAKIIHVRDNAQRERYRKCFASSVGGTSGGGGGRDSAYENGGDRCSLSCLGVYISYFGLT